MSTMGVFVPKVGELERKMIVADNITERVSSAVHALWQIQASMPEGALRSALMDQILRINVISDVVQNGLS